MYDRFDQDAGDTMLKTSEENDVRELELELIRIRAEARAARLEARAAEIELMLRRSTRNQAARIGSTDNTFDSASSPEAIPSSSILQPSGQLPTELTLANPNRHGDQNQPPVFDIPAEHAESNYRDKSNASSTNEYALPRITSWEALLQAAQDIAQSDTEKGDETSIPVQHVAEEPAENAQPPEKTVAKLPAEPSNTQLTKQMLPSIDLRDDSTAKKLDDSDAQVAVDALTQVETEISGGQADGKTEKRRPAAWIVSVLAHAAVLLLLAGITLSVPDPKDQIALSAAATQPAEEQIETVELQQTEQPETESDSQSETLTTVNPVGEIASAVVDVTGPGIPDVIANPGESLSEMLGASVSAGAPSDVSATFFGASGGGNHFVYLVDSSASMDNVSRDGFDVARSEVLRAVDSLNEKQRFYVIFFGQETMRMRLSDPNEPEPRAAYATDENKRALKRWAATIQMQQGKWPEESLEFAFTLRPDCIFLLTDGAMPQSVPDFVKRNNIVETLLDGPKPRSIIHTIGFHNTEGEAILSKIAKENGGTYNFVPANVSSRR